MAIGTVKWFDPQKGFGFLLNQTGHDVFVHYTSIDGEGFRCLRNGQKVEYHELQTGKGLQGRQVKPLSTNPQGTADNDEIEQALL